MKENAIGRPVDIVSIGFANKSLKEIAEIVDNEGKKGADLVVLPETWPGMEPETLDGVTITAMAHLAQKHKMYVLSPIFRKGNGIKRINSAVLLDRQGEVAGIYDKVFPYWSEFDLDPPTEVGMDAPVFETDFGRVGIAICFDSNFPEVWKALADKGAELVLYPSAYSAGTTLQAHALNHNYYIVSATGAIDCIVYDITGRKLLYESDKELNISRITLDLDRGIYHYNFNLEKLDQLLKDHADSIEREIFMDREQWFVLRAKRSGVSARKLAYSYGLEELRDYRNRSRQEIDKMRGFKFYEKVVKATYL